MTVLIADADSQVTHTNECNNYTTLCTSHTSIWTQKILARFSSTAACLSSISKFRQMQQLNPPTLFIQGHQKRDIKSKSSQWLRYETGCWRSPSLQTHLKSTTWKGSPQDFQTREELKENNKSHCHVSILGFTATPWGYYPHWTTNREMKNLTLGKSPQSQAS